jgi:hypothetical protein
MRERCATVGREPRRTNFFRLLHDSRRSHRLCSGRKEQRVRRAKSLEKCRTRASVDSYTDQPTLGSAGQVRVA